MVDRLDVHKQQCFQQTSTNSPFDLIFANTNPIPYFNLYICPGGHRGGGTPDPIPNSEVKPSFADDTAYSCVGK